VLPLTLTIIFVLLYFTFRTLWQPLLIMATLPFALIGGYWLLYLLHYKPVGGGGRGLHRTGPGWRPSSGWVMLIYLDQAVKQRESRRPPGDPRRPDRRHCRRRRPAGAAQKP